MREQLALLPEYLTAHLQLTLAALLLGVFLSVPLGVLVHRVRWLEQPVSGAASIIQTIPGLALLAVMVPLLAALKLPSIGFLPAFLALVLYGILPVLRNTVTGLATIDPALLEAADGVGMTPRQRLTRVELPLAMPVIIAGIRTATVWTVGMATLSTPVGAPSLGNYIFSGLQTRNYQAVLVGSLAAAALALLLDNLVRLVALGIKRRSRLLLVVALSSLGVLAAYAAATLARDLWPDGKGPVRIGAKTFTEQYILSEILSRQLAPSLAHPPEVVSSLGSSVAFDALRLGEIDVYVDYSGTIYATIMKKEGAADRETVLREVTRYLKEEHGIVVAGALGFENTYALAMRRARAEALGITRVGDLTPHAGRMSIGGDYEFFGRAEWQAIKTTYGLSFATERSMDPSLMYQAVAQGEVDVISAFSTDGRIAALDLVVLADDRAAIPPYDAIILVSARFAKEEPEALAALRRLANTIDAEEMRQMNLAVDQEGKTPGEVAAEFLNFSGVR